MHWLVQIISGLLSLAPFTSCVGPEPQQLSSYGEIPAPYGVSPCWKYPSGATIRHRERLKVTRFEVTSYLLYRSAFLKVLGWFLKLSSHRVLVNVTLFVVCKDWSVISSGSNSEDQTKHSKAQTVAFAVEVGVTVIPRLIPYPPPCCSYFCSRHVRFLFSPFKKKESFLTKNTVVELHMVVRFVFFCGRAASGLVLLSIRSGVPSSLAAPSLLDSHQHLSVGVLILLHSHVERSCGTAASFHHQIACRLRFLQQIWGYRDQNVL